MLQARSKMIQLYTYTFITFEVIFHYRLLEDSDYSYLRYTVTKQVTFELHSSASSSVRPVSGSKWSQKVSLRNQPHPHDLQRRTFPHNPK